MDTATFIPRVLPSQGSLSTTCGLKSAQHALSKRKPHDRWWTFQRMTWNGPIEHSCHSGLHGTKVLRIVWVSLPLVYGAPRIGIHRPSEPNVRRVRRELTVRIGESGRILFKM